MELVSTPDSGWVCGWKLGAEPQAGVCREVTVEAVTVYKVSEKGLRGLLGPI